jgi:hypothetical protein
MVPCLSQATFFQGQARIAAKNGPFPSARDLMSQVLEAPMAAGRVLMGIALAAAMAAPASTDAGQRGRDRSDRRQEQRDVRGDDGRDGQARAVPRSRERVDVQRQYDRRRDDSRRVYVRPNYSNRGWYGSRTVVVPRYVYPRVLTVVPYRPYVYRPHLGLGVYYGSGGYPYGYTPRGYYDPIPGRLYGGLRITDAPREAQVFADGYYVGIVNDFDGVFQHLNLEAGPHRIEIRMPGFNDAVVFDVDIQPGRTITYRADW